MRRIWFWRPCWYWHGWRTLLPVQFGGDEYGRRTLMFGWTVTGRVIVAVSRPGRLYRPDFWHHHDDLTGITVRADIYPYGGGVQQHGVQLSVLRDGEPVAVVRIPQSAVRELAELIGASRSLVWHDPRDADDPFWNPRDEPGDEAEQREPWYLLPWLAWTVAGIGLAAVALGCFGAIMQVVLGGTT